MRAFERIPLSRVGGFTRRVSSAESSTPALDEKTVLSPVDGSLFGSAGKLGDGGVETESHPHSERRSSL